MEEQSNVAFKNYIDSYKKLATDDKKEQIIEELKSILVMTEKMCADMKIIHEPLVNKETLDLSNKHTSEDEYLEAVFVYVQSVKDSLGTYGTKMTDLFYE